MVLFGRNGESPVPIVAASTPSQCFHAAIEAAASRSSTAPPVYLLSDAYLANGSEPWLIPDVGGLPDISTSFAEPRRRAVRAVPPRQPLARPWAVEHPGLEHRIGGLEGGRDGRHLLRPGQPRRDGSAARQRWQGSPPTSPSSTSTTRAGTRTCSSSAGDRPRRSGRPCAASGAASRSRAHFHHLSPFPANTGEVLPLSEGARPRDEPRPAGSAPAGTVPRRRRLVLEGARPAAQRGQLEQAILAMEGSP